MKDLPKLVLSVAICEGVGILGSIFTISSISLWYATLNKPFFTPPNWLFGPAWTTLYFLMGISLFLVWKKGLKKKEVREALVIFDIQLILNFLWSIIFFRFQNPLLAFIEIIILWAVILLTISKFKKISKLAAYLLIPYILWVSFAAILNLSILILN